MDIKYYQSLLREQVEQLPIEEFHKLALSQSKFWPDMLNFNTEEEIVEMFYKAYNRNPILMQRENLKNSEAYKKANEVQKK